jgi:hypothetical protein
LLPPLLVLPVVADDEVEPEPLAVPLAVLVLVLVPVPCDPLVDAGPPPAPLPPPPAVPVCDEFPTSQLAAAATARLVTIASNIFEAVLMAPP